MTNKDSSQHVLPKNTNEFRSWLEQLEAIYMHYYVKRRHAGEDLSGDTQARHWQRYDHDKSP